MADRATALLLCLIACGESQPTEIETQSACPQGTVKTDGDCRATSFDRPCNPACEPSSLCIGGACAPQNVPDISGYWRGGIRIVYDCDVRGQIMGADFPLSWDVVQTGTTATIVDALGVVRRAAVTEADVLVPYEADAPAYALDAMLEGAASHDGNMIRGPVSGDFTEYSRSDPRSRDYVPGYMPPCDSGTASRFEVRRQRASVPSAFTADVTGTWRGPISFTSSCLGTPFGLIAWDSQLTAQLFQWEDGRVDAMLELVTSPGASRPFLSGDVTGSSAQTTLKLDTGTLVGNDGTLHLAPPAGQSKKGWGLIADLSWTGRYLDGELLGWQSRNDPDTPYPCVLHDTVFRLTRQE